MSCIFDATYISIAIDCGQFLVEQEDFRKGILHKHKKIVRNVNANFVCELYWIFCVFFTHK